MALSHVNPLSLLLILVIVLVLFGANKLRNIGGDLGAAVKNFRAGLEGNEEKNQSDKKDGNNPS